MENIEFMMDIDAPKEKVWNSLVDQQKLRKWWGEKNLKIEPKMGGQFSESHANKNGNVIRIQGYVIALVPNHRLSITWRKSNWDGETLVTFYFLPQDEKTKLYFLHSEWNNLSGKTRESQRSISREEWKERLANLKSFAEKQNR